MLAPTPWPPFKGFLLTALTMVAFAGNSLLNRAALLETEIDAASFTAIRLISGAVTLAFILKLRGNGDYKAGDWPSAAALFVYAAGFSWAYIHLTTATGALLLFGAVQVTMIAWALHKGDRLNRLQTLGFLGACGGLVAMLLPGVQAPPIGAACLMLLAGVAWGVYSLKGKGAGNPLAATTGNFWRASILGLGLSLLALPHLSLESTGILLAIASGAVASGMGYALWYSVLEHIPTTTSAIVQLTVPVIAALFAVILLHEPVTTRLALTSLVVLGGVALVILAKHKKA